MSDTMVNTAPRAPGTFNVQWGPVIAGAIAAAALATVLHAFAAAIGLAVGSTAPTWRDASIGLWILSGVYLILVALASYGLGGYVAGILRDRFATAGNTDEVEFRDGVHGLLVWALATLLTALFLLMAVSASTRLAAPSGTAGPSASVAGENTIAFDLDRLSRRQTSRRCNGPDIYPSGGSADPTDLIEPLGSCCRRSSLPRPVSQRPDGPGSTRGGASR